MTTRETSRTALDQISPKRADLQAQFLAILSLSTHPLTANEVACGNESLRKRAKELVDAGKIVKCPRRKCSMTGFKVTTYAVAKAQGELF